MPVKNLRHDPASRSLKALALCTVLSAALAGCKTGFEASMPCLALAAPDGAACDSPETTRSLPGGDPVRETRHIQDTKLVSDPVPMPDYGRTEVKPQLLSLAVEPAKSLATQGAMEALRTMQTEKAVGRGEKSKATMGRSIKSLPIADAVAVAVLSHPLMGAQAARIRASDADLRGAEAGLMPTLSAYAGTGQGTTGTYSNYPTPVDTANIAGTWRTDMGFNFRQLIHDFGATRLEIERNRSLIDSEKYKLADQAEDIALRTVNAFLNLLEQGELIRIIDQIVVQQRELAGIVRLNQQGGNGTKADLDHIQAKVIEIEALRTDIKTAYQTAMDEFNRLTGLRPQQVRRPRASRSIVPPTVEAALEKARAKNPSLAALNATGISIDQQIEGTRASKYPKLELQGEGVNKHYQGVKKFSTGVLDVKAMATLSFKLYDGGLLEAQTDRLRANAATNAFKLLDEREAVELNLRRFYLTMASSRVKHDAAKLGLNTANSVKKLYTEQFKSGKRTIFEVLDSNVIVFTMERNRVNGEYEEMRALFGILRNMGQLCEYFARPEGGGKPLPPGTGRRPHAALKAEGAAKSAANPPPPSPMPETASPMPETASPMPETASPALAPEPPMVLPRLEG